MQSFKKGSSNSTTSTANSPRVPLSREEERNLRTLASQTQSFKNPFDERDNVLKEKENADEDLVEFSSQEKLTKDGSKPQGTKQNTTTGGDKLDKQVVEEYCGKYSENYAFYCLDVVAGAESSGGIDKTATAGLKDHLEKFCPSYDDNCPQEAAKLKSSFDSKAGPEVSKQAKSTNEKESSFLFPKETSTSSPTLLAPSEISSSGSPAASFPDLLKSSIEEEKLKELKKRRPCTPDCNRRIWKHCTAECKCDYSYPAVQRFCNPPPLPFFLNTCRLWYEGCPKYEGYHYASQFVYSKAEKGKVLPGRPAPTQAIAPYGPIDAGRLGKPTARAADDPRPSASALLSAIRHSKHEEHTGHNRSQHTPAHSSSSNNDDKKAWFQSNRAAQVPIIPSDSGLAASRTIQDFDAYTDTKGVLHRPRSTSPFTKPGLWEANPADPHNRDHANKWWYAPSSVGADWLSGQVTWGGHWAVPAAGVGGTAGYSAIHFPTVGTFLNIADDYD
uniref:Uncharacterized protein n=1 Tax=Ditylenchus dipsaci TaxID=166011 RepID=A0A915D214_9BILA